MSTFTLILVEVSLGEKIHGLRAVRGEDWEKSIIQ